MEWHTTGTFVVVVEKEKSTVPNCTNCKKMLYISVVNLHAPTQYIWKVFFLLIKAQLLIGHLFYGGRFKWKLFLWNMFVSSF